MNHTQARSERQYLDIPARTAALFDDDYYLQVNPDVQGDPLAHYWKIGRHEGRRPNPLFDPVFYTGQLHGSRTPSDLLSHYVEVGETDGLSPHPLFSPAYYRSQLDSDPPNLLEHYLLSGWKGGLSPHPLFDPAYYVVTAGGSVGRLGPLAHYLTQETFGGTPHYLFSDAYYVAEIEKTLLPSHRHAYRGGPPLEHYALHGHRYRTKTHPLFDPDYYVARHAKVLGRGDPARDLSPTREVNLLYHYSTVGWRHGASPSPYFDLAYYRSQADVPTGEDPLRHYLTPGNYGRSSPHPGIDLDFYSEHAGFLRDDTPAILHLLATPTERRVSTHPAFDPVRYKSIYGDISSGNLCPILHFLAHGIAEDRSPNEWYSHDYVFNRDPLVDFSAISSLQYCLASYERQQPVRLVFVSHDAGLTGAPGTVLRLVEDFSSFTNVECFAIVAGSGPRIPDFARVAHTLTVNQPFHSADPVRLRQIVHSLLEVTEGNVPVAAIVNSAESRLMGQELAKAGIPVVTLIHEAADLYPEGAFEPIVDASARIIFGSQFVLERARKAVALPAGIAEVRGQGLQQDHVGTMNREAARRAVLKELRLPKDAFLVLGCGSIDYRKGVDFFVSAAIDVLRRKPTEKEICFAWLGETHGNQSMLQAFVRSAVESSGYQSEIRFIGARSDVEPYFVAADTFLVTSRVDPFPCVAQEAMAAGLPIVAFTEGGGTVEMIGSDAGHCVPLGDTGAMADRILELAADADLRARLGARGKSIVRERWRPQDYAAHLAGAVSEVSGIAPHMLGQPWWERTKEGRHVFVLMENWLPSTRTSEVEELVKRLNSRGYATEIVLTRGRFASPPESGRPLPRVPYRFLQPANVVHRQRWHTSVAEVRRGIRNLCRAHLPCIVIAYDDPVAAALMTSLPPTVGALAVVNTASSDAIQQAYHLAPGLDGLVFRSAEAAEALFELNPYLAGKTHIVAPAMETSPSQPTPGSGPALYVRANLADQSAARIVSVLRQLIDIPGLSIKVHSDSSPLEDTASKQFELFLSSSQPTYAELFGGAGAAVFVGEGAAHRELVLAAMSHGAVPILVDPGVDADHVVDSRCGLVLRNAGANAIAEAVVRLFTGETGSTLRQRAFEWAASHSSGHDEVASQFNDLCAGLFAQLEEQGSSRSPTPATGGLPTYYWPPSLRENSVLEQVILP